MYCVPIKMVDMCVLCAAAVGDKNLLSLNDTWHRLVEHCTNKRCFVHGDDFPPLQPMSPRVRVP